MKHKPISPKEGAPAASEARPLKLEMKSGDCVLMKGKTQANWLHSIPKRKGKGTNEGRINITFRRAMVPSGTDNYYRYNVGGGDVWRWDRGKKEMVVFKQKDRDCP